MPYLNHLDFEKVHAVLAAASASSPDFDAVLKLMDTAKSNVASPGLCELARELHGTDECEIDDEGASTSPTDEGTWVQSWVWVQRQEMRDAGLIPMIDCGQCEGTGIIPEGHSGEGEQCPVCDGDGEIEEEDDEVLLDKAEQKHQAQ